MLIRYDNNRNYRAVRRRIIHSRKEWLVIWQEQKYQWWKEYYEAQIKEKEEAFEKEKAELIRTFEEPAVLEETEEPETTGTEEAPSEAPVIIETKEIVEETEVD